jgi:BirA family biotin operon repressor/biotin-[acetyl-CoA-carboxylase] ligase
MPLDATRLRELLPECEVHYYSTTPTTMQEAARLAAAGAPAGTLVLADEQTAGRGRHGRQWMSEAGSGLYMTIVLRPAETLPMLTLAVGIAVHDAAAALGADCDLRWPNDLLIGKRKCAGILVSSDGGAVLAGIGVNCDQPAFPSEIAHLATSLLIATGTPVDREALAAAIVKGILRWTSIPTAGVREAFIERSSYARGRRVILEDSGVTGQTMGLDDQGFLLLRHEDGTVERVLAGGVRPL